MPPFCTSRRCERVTTSSRTVPVRRMMASSSAVESASGAVLRQLLARALALGPLFDGQTVLGHGGHCNTGTRCGRKLARLRTFYIPSRNIYISTTAR